MLIVHLQTIAANCLLTHINCLWVDPIDGNHYLGQVHMGSPIQAACLCGCGRFIGGFSWEGPGADNLVVVNWHLALGCNVFTRV